MSSKCFGGYIPSHLLKIWRYQLSFVTIRKTVNDLGPIFAKPRPLRGYFSCFLTDRAHWLNKLLDWSSNVIYQIWCWWHIKFYSFYCFKVYANLKKICNSGFHDYRGSSVEDYQEDVYEKFQVNSTYGLAGRAIRSLHPMFTFLEQHLVFIYIQRTKFRVSGSCQLAINW